MAFDLQSVCKVDSIIPILQMGKLYRGVCPERLGDLPKAT